MRGSAVGRKLPREEFWQVEILIGKIVPKIFGAWLKAERKARGQPDSLASFVSSDMLKRMLYFFGLLLLAAFVAVKFFGVDVNQTVLDCLAGVKKITGSQVNWQALDSLDTHPISHGDWATLTARHVTPDGRVDYRGFWADSTLLRQYLALLSQNPPNRHHWNEAEQLAYWINAYNAFTVQLILENYPVGSIKQLGGSVPMVNSPWDLKFFQLGGIDFDLNTIEHEVLRQQFDEPRIHFAINCASKSCPKLRNEAYTSQRLELQLEEQVQDFLLDESKNKIGPEQLQLSPIFDWFRSDFTKNGGLQAFLDTHFADDISPDAPIEFLDYDWSLNE